MQNRKVKNKKNTYILTSRGVFRSAKLTYHTNDINLKMQNTRILASIVKMYMINTVVVQLLNI